MNFNYIYILTVYLIAINIISVIVTIMDKYKSIKGKWRIKESALFILSALGGSLGMYITMKIIKHKTRHLKFMLGIPLIFVAQCIIALVLWRICYV